MRFSLDKHKPMFYKRAVNHKGVIMSLRKFLHGLKRLFVVTTILLLSWVFVFLAVVGAEHIVYDHMLFGLLK